MRWLARLLIPLIVGLLAFFLATEWVWEQSAEIADDDRWRPRAVAAIVAVIVLAWPLSQRITSRVKAVAVGLTALLAAVFFLLPNLEPATVDSFEFRNFLVERDVPLGDYQTHHPVRSLLKDGSWKFPSVGDPKLDVRGTVVLFDAEVKGRADESIEIRWDLFDASLIKRVAKSEAIDPLCLYRIDAKDACVARTPERRDADVAGFEFWVDTSRFPEVVCFFIRLEAISGGTRLTAADSVDFPGTGIEDC